MSKVSIDLEGMFKEMEMIYEKYGVPKGMGFVPDKLEIILERKEIDKFNLTYTEFFNYLPYNALTIVIEYTLRLLQQIGFPPEKITRIENGVKVQISGDFQIALFPLLEILVQNKGNGKKFKSTLDSISKTYQIFTTLIDFHWDWNDEIESKFNNYIQALNKVMREYPSICLLYTSPSPRDRS